MINNEQIELNKLTSTEWRLLLFSAFINEYIAKKEESRIIDLRKKLVSLEKGKNRFKDYKIDFNRFLFITKNTFRVCLFILFVVYFSLDIFLIFFSFLSYTSIFNYTGAMLFDYLAQFFSTLTIFVTAITGFPILILFGIFGVDSSFFHPELSIRYFVSCFLVSLVSLTIIYIILNYLRNSRTINKKSIQYENSINKTRKFIDVTMETYGLVENCISLNLNDIYSLGLIPEEFHKYNELGILYGYFLMNTNITLNEALDMYSKDAIDNSYRIKMSEISNFLSDIAYGKHVFDQFNKDLKIELTNLIKQNDEYISDKKNINTYVYKIYENTKSMFLKINS